MPGTPVINSFASVTDGSASISATSPRDQLRVTGTGAATVSVSSPAGVPTLTVDVPVVEIPEPPAQVPPNSYFVGTGGYASLEAAVAALGSTPSTVEYSTDQTLTGNFSSPPTLEIIPRNGAKIIHSAYTVSYAGSTARWPLALVFDGTGAVTGLSKSRPEYFGAAGDGVADDTTAMNAGIAACADWGTVKLTKAEYRTTSVVTVNHPVVLDGAYSQIVADHDGIGLRIAHASLAYFGNSTEGININVSVRKGGTQRASGSIGVSITGLFDSEVRLPRVEGFETGVLLDAKTWNAGNGSFAHNSFFLGNIRNNTYGLKLYSSNSAWVNSNRFYGGSFGGGDGGVADSAHVTIDGPSTSQANQNTFYSPTLEGSHKIGFYFGTSYANSVLSPRFEMPSATYLLQFVGGNNSQSNAIWNGYGLNDKIDKISDAGLYNKIVSAGYKGSYEYYGGTWFEFVGEGDAWSDTNFSASDTRVPIGALPLKILSGQSGTVTLDMLQGRFFRVGVTGDVTSVVFDNILPTAQQGAKLRVQFNQPAGGAIITGFASAWKFGNRFFPPVGRANGIDIYELVYTSAGQWLVTGHHASGSSIGAAVASASTIAASGPIFHVTGTATINTISVPFSGFTGNITLIPDGVFATGTSGNIAIASTSVIGKTLIMTYDGTKWYPSY
jgi:hypothetical protein